MNENEMICPIMSRAGYSEIGSYEPIYAFCVEDKCQFWIEVDATWGGRAYGCSMALSPMIVSGKFVS